MLSSPIGRIYVSINIRTMITKLRFPSISRSNFSLFRDPGIIIGNDPGRNADMLYLFKSAESNLDFEDRECDIAVKR